MPIASPSDNLITDTRVRLCFLSASHLTRLARSVLDDYADRADIEVIDAQFHSALALAQNRVKAGDTDAFVSAGANATLLRNGLKAPVATIKVGGYDILLAMMKAREVSPRVGVVTFIETIPELDAVRDLLKLDIAQHAYRTQDDARDCVDSLARSNYPVVVGSSVVIDLAQERGLCGVLAYSLQSVRQGIEDAIELARVARLEAARYEQLDGVLRNLQEAVLAVDESHRIIAVNRPMEALLNRTRSALLGCSLDAFGSALSLQATLTTGEEERAAVVQYAQRDWIANRTPILERGRIAGAVLTLHDANVIRDADTNLRSQRKTRLPPTARYRFDNLQGKSPGFKRARETAVRFASTDLTVLIRGESGTGKELFAQSIHHASMRSDRPFVAVNCAAFPEALLESELFGHEEGAFTGARKGGKRGLFETAHTGTLFLDEIGDMPLSLQTRLLRVLQEREVVRLGGTIPIPVDVRVLAATHQSLDTMMRERRFRPDLYYRLNILQLNLPPLRERQEDIFDMAQTMMERCLRRLGSALDATTVLAPVSQRLLDYPWPGNVRELENLCERMAVYFAQFPTTETLQYQALTWDCPELFSDAPLASRTDDPTDPAPVKPLAQVLHECDGSRKEAARRLGISRATLWRRLKAQTKGSEE